MMVLMRTLTEFGRPDLALKIATNETYKTWLDWIDGMLFGRDGIYMVLKLLMV